MKNQWLVNWPRLGTPIAHYKERQAVVVCRKGEIMMGWVISVAGGKPARQPSGLEIVGRNTSGGAWRFSVQGARWQGGTARHVLAELIASHDSAPKQEK